jgi:Arc/MetJ family transcription regulator
MRTNIELDDELVREVMDLYGLKTKKAAVEEALRSYAQRKRQRQALDELRGIGWEGDLEEMRLGFPGLDPK